MHADIRGLQGVFLCFSLITATPQKETCVKFKIYSVQLHTKYAKFAPLHCWLFGQKGVKYDIERKI